MRDHFRQEVPRAWGQVALIFVVQIFSFGARPLIGLLIRPWEREFLWSRATISLIASVGFIALGFIQPLAGRWADRLGPRLVITASLFLMGFALAGVRLIHSLWQAYLIIGVFLMLAVGGTSNVTGSVVIARWIRHHRALAVGLALSGSAVGQMMLVPSMAGLIQWIGWRAAFPLLSLVVLLLVAPLIAALLRNDPPGSQAQVPDPHPVAPPAAFAREANFWRLAGSFAIAGFGAAGLVDTHLVPYAQDHGIPAVTAASAFTLMGAVNMVSTFTVGAMSDRLGHRRVLGWIHLGRALALLLLLSVRGPATLFLFAAAFALVNFSIVPPTTALVTTLFGPHSAGTVMGFVALGHQLGSAVGAFAGGLVHDLAGGYAPAILTAAVLAGAGCLLVWRTTER